MTKYVLTLFIGTKKCADILYRYQSLSEDMRVGS